ncbi:sensor histidine kinase [Piscinibacter terrae]|uniref:histidine kinase n=1 Tax=Piscinibacter terrae TaxID=2496871 RepID=A0A3N7JKQ2_9BURK|nr:sensor histidine kinase [Albitalea terrae]RQP21879.1 sensor histidine kinase [Albitalea terrae]
MKAWRPRGPMRLRTQLYLWLLGPMLLLTLAGAWLSHASARDMARAAAERTLLGSARMIGEAIAAEEDLRAELPPAALENLETAVGDRVYYRADHPQRGLLLGFADFPRYNAALPAEQWHGFETSLQGEPVHVVAFAQPVYPFERGSAVIVQVATTQRAERALVSQLWLRSLWPPGLLLVAVAVLGWVWVKVALAPVTRISEQLQAHAVESTGRFDGGDVPGELRPLVRAIDGLTDRIAAFVAERGRFIANAAHQLKTPLTVLNTQVTVGLRADEPGAKQQALSAIYDTAQRCIRLIHQLLTLSASDHRMQSPPQASEVDLRDVVREVLEDLAEPAHGKNIDLGAGDWPASQVSVRGVPLLLREMVANLVDNAIRYAPEGGTVSVSVRATSAGVVLTVEDNGPGIPPAERQHVFERFYRLPDAGSHDGSGLGLAIVREIAIACDASITLEDRPDGGPGLVVRVCWPVPSHTPTVAAPQSGGSRE